MYKTICVSDIKKKVKLTPFPMGKKCRVVIDGTHPLEMVYEHFKGFPGGIRWYCICPVTKKRCRKLVLIENKYQHISTIKDYYRKIKPEWWSESSLNPILVTKQKGIDAEKMMSQKHFKSYYSGKPTKKYLKCLKYIEDAKDITFDGIINGMYG